MKNARVIMFVVPLFLLHCAASIVKVDMEGLGRVRTIAVLPFTSGKNLDKGILEDSEIIFAGALSCPRYRIVEREKVRAFLKDTGPGMTVDKAVRAERVLGADAVITGEITEYAEVQKVISPFSGGSFGMIIFNDRDDETEIRTYYKFRITIKMFSTADGREILSMSNRYGEAEHDDYLPGYTDLASFRRNTLKKMAKEFKGTFKKPD